ncbi:hypothetical protein [Bradyrhizobium sp. 150]|uniref:hypothetical protein n=1 Tax=Bradyrhizobium sp. 150 TaxID=2782625 RepID=UPI001FF99C8D|nr:hypothetical protein [Bradyrhizobium sp. 150]MCK1671072.1 hypothetical protein [Bradyrhizobium sp. 150]
MNALTTNTNGQHVVVADDFDPFAEYANSMGGSRIVGSLLKFSKGDYLVGQNGDIMQEGTQLAVNMNELITGWIKWKDKKPVDTIMGKLFDPETRKSFQPPKRDALGDLDETTWEVDKDGNAQDPWQFTNYLLMKVPGLDDQDALFTFAASGKGSLGAIGKLCDSYSKLRRMRQPGEMPVVKLGVGKYKHDEYGWIKFPTFTIVGWVKAGEFDAALAEEAAQAKADDAARKAADEDIPF